METNQQRYGTATRRAIGLGHVVVGGAALVVAAVMILAGRAPDAGLGGVWLGLGLWLALAAALFTGSALLALRRVHEGREGSLSIVLSVVELVAGVAAGAGLVVAVRGYGAFEPWRSPLLLPSALLVALGLAGLGPGVSARRPQAQWRRPGPTARRSAG